jgi:hypothetical protein
MRWRGTAPPCERRRTWGASTSLFYLKPSLGVADRGVAAAGNTLLNSHPVELELHRSSATSFPAPSDPARSNRRTGSAGAGSNSLQHVYEKAISEGLLAAPQTLPDRIPEETAPDHIDPPATPFVLPADEPVHHPNETEQEIPSLTLKQVGAPSICSC